MSRRWPEVLPRKSFVSWINMDVSRKRRKGWGQEMRSATLRNDRLAWLWRHVCNVSVSPTRCKRVATGKAAGSLLHRDRYCTFVSYHIDVARVKARCTL